MTIMTRGGARTFWKEELPKGVIYMYREFVHEEWTAYTIAEHNAKKKEKQENNIARKRYSYFRVPCYIHVFKVNNGGFIFGGFYIVILTVHNIYYLNWRIERKHEDFFPRIRKHLPFGLLPFDDQTWDEDQAWLKEFCKNYPMKPKGIQNPRGKYITHCILDTYHNLIDIELEKILEPAAYVAGK
jgi:hypothetical protein